MPRTNIQEIPYETTDLARNGDPNHHRKKQLPFIRETITLPAYDDLPHVSILRRKNSLNSSCGRITHAPNFVGQILCAVWVA